MRFTHEQFIPLPRDRVFAFHENPANLALIQKGGGPFRLLSHGKDLQPGSTTWVEVGLFRILPVVMGFEHHLYEPPLRFAEHMIHGPFKYFSHTHHFISQDGGTLVRDEIDLLLPWYYGGRLMTRLVVFPITHHMFTQRGQRLIEMAAEGIL